MAAGLMQRRLPLLGLTLSVSLVGCLVACSPTASSLPSGPVAVASPSPSASRGVPSFIPLMPAPSPTFLTYRVKAGDSLESIARRFSTTGRSIAYWNRAIYPSLDPDSPGYAPNQIAIGWALVLIPGETVDPSELPEASPSQSPGPGQSTLAGTKPGPSPSASPGGTAGTASLLRSHGPRTSRQIALTFDMGGRLDPAVDIMDWLVANQVKATIFPTGQMSTTPIGKQVLALLKGHPELFAVGNHTYDHPELTGLTATQVKSQLTRAEGVIAPLAGRTTRPFFRPPFGSQNATILSAAGAAGWKYTMIWDVDTIDWRPTSDGGPSADDIVAKILSRAQGGSIVLMHLGGYNTLEALPAVLHGLSELGLEPVKLDAWFPAR
jgi:peptidoglycan/xylan/chitin deacetylase (PgdA/CDA1 family)